MPIHTSTLTPALTTYKSTHMPIPTSTSIPALTIQKINVQNFANAFHRIQIKFNNATTEQQTTPRDW